MPKFYNIFFLFSSKTLCHVLNMLYTMSCGQGSWKWWGFLLVMDFRQPTMTTRNSKPILLTTLSHMCKLVLIAHRWLRVATFSTTSYSQELKVKGFKRVVSILMIHEDVKSKMSRQHWPKNLWKPIIGGNSLIVTIGVVFACHQWLERHNII